MNYKEAQAAGFVVTEAEYQAIQGLIAEEYLAANKAIEARLAKLYAQYADASTSENIYNWLIQFDRHSKLHADVQAAYIEHSKAAGTLQAESARLAMTNNYYRQAYTLAYAHPQMTFAMLNPLLVDVAVLGQAELWAEIPKKARESYISPDLWLPSDGTLSQLLADNRTRELRAIQQQINAGLISGQGYAKTAKAVSQIIGTYTRTESTGAIANAMRISVTEGNRALNAGAYANDLAAADQGLDMVRIWDATLDTRTRPEHGRMDGKKAKVNEPFKFPSGWSAMYPGAIRTGNSKLDASQNIRCRCTTVSTVNGTEPTLRRGRNPVTGKTEVFTYTTFDQWAKSNNLTRNKYGRLLSGK